MLTGDAGAHALNVNVDIVHPYLYSYCMAFGVAQPIIIMTVLSMDLWYTYSCVVQGLFENTKVKQSRSG